jgi:hypothetical protein
MTGLTKTDDQSSSNKLKTAERFKAEEQKNIRQGTLLIRRHKTRQSFLKSINYFRERLDRMS